MTNALSLPIVFLPGMYCDQRLWLEQIMRINLQTQTQFIDLRQLSSIEKMIKAIKNITFDKFILCGFSMGGYVAQEFTVANPSRVSHLILVSVSGEGLSPQEYQARVQFKNLLEKGYAHKVSENQISSYLHPDSYRKDEIANLVRSMINDNSLEMFLDQINATLNRRNLTKEIAETNIPLTLIGGSQDKHIPIDKYFHFSKSIPNSNLYLIENCGHFVPIEKPSEMTNILKNIV